MHKRLTSEWLDARDAAIFLKPCTAKHLNEELGANLERKSANRPTANSARGGGWLYHRHELERVRAIMDALGCSAAKAVWLLHGLRTLGKRKMIPHLELTLAEATAAEEKRAADLAALELSPGQQRLRRFQ